MAAGKKLLWAREVDSSSWEDELAIAKADAILLTSVSAKSSVDNSGNKIVVVNAVAVGSITLANYASFGIGSVIIDTTAAKIHIKTTATQWKSFEASTNQY